MKEKRWALIMLNRTALTVFLYASFLYFLKRIVFVKRHVWFFRIYLRLYVSVQNLLTLTKYSGLDPEIGSSNATLNGIDQGFYPQARTWTIGLNVKF